MTKEDLPVGKSNNKKQGETGGSLKSIPENSEQFSNPKSADIWAGIKSAGSHNVFSLISEAVYQLSKRRFSHQYLRWLQSTKNRQKRYRVSYIPKKMGGYRQIDIPASELKSLLRSILQLLSEKFHPHPLATGFVSGKSITTNANPHIDKKEVLVIDLKDFFPSITWVRIFGMFRESPFNASKDLARVLSQLVTLNSALPQGSPISPFLSNMICRRMDSRLSQWAIKNHISYSRYADDITFSSNEVNKFHDITRALIIDIITDEGFQINENKFRIMSRSERKIVTGIVVNKRLNVKKKYIRNLRAILHNVAETDWSVQALKYYNITKRISFDLKNEAAFNVSSSECTANVHYSPKEWLHFSKHKKKYFKNNGVNKMGLKPNISRLCNHNLNLKMMNGINMETKKKPSDARLVKNFMSIIRGKIEFVGQIRGKNDTVYLNLVNSYNFLQASKG